MSDQAAPALCVGTRDTQKGVALELRWGKLGGRLVAEPAAVGLAGGAGVRSAGCQGSAAEMQRPGGAGSLFLNAGA